MKVNLILLAPKCFSLHLDILVDYIQYDLYYSEGESQYVWNLFKPKTYIDMCDGNFLTRLIIQSISHDK